MHIFLITQYYPPETGAAASRWGDYTDILINQGHSVTVLCEIPNYPKGEYFSGYKNKWKKIEKISPNLTIIRTKTYASDRKSFIKKIIHYLTFMISGAINSLKVKNFDLLIISSPPLFTGFIGIILKKLFKIDYWFDVRDLWPASAVELGQINKGFLLRCGKKLESTIYNSAKGFITPVPSFNKYFHNFSSHVSNKPMFELMNGVSESFIKLSKSINVETDKKFTVIYTGNMGIAQDLSTIIVAATILKDYDINFRFIGDGICRSDIELLAKPLKNKIYFHDSMSREDLIYWIKKASICLVPLKNKKLFYSALPSKMFEYMACKKPVILGIKGDAEKVINIAKCGITIEPENATMLSEAILTYYNNSNKCIEDGQKGSFYVRSNLSKEVLISQLLNNIKEYN